MPVFVTIIEKLEPHKYEADLPAELKDEIVRELETISAQNDNPKIKQRARNAIRQVQFLGKFVPQSEYQVLEPTKGEPAGIVEEIMYYLR